MPEELAEMGGLSTFVVPQLDGIYFCNMVDGKIVQKVPLEHFKIIAETWRGFSEKNTIEG
jgi:hypothetical protein